MKKIEVTKNKYNVYINKGIAIEVDNYIQKNKMKAYKFIQLAIIEKLKREGYL